MEARERVMPFQCSGVSAMALLCFEISMKKDSMTKRVRRWAKRKYPDASDFTIWLIVSRTIDKLVRQHAVKHKISNKIIS